MRAKLLTDIIWAVTATAVYSLTYMTAASAQASPQECAAIGDSLQRLTCFDKLFPKPEPHSKDDKTDTSAIATNWDISEERSPIDDSVRITAFLLPKDTEKTVSSMRGPSIMLRCRDNVTSVYYTHGKFAVNDRIKISYRLGNSAPKSDKWTRSSDREAAGLWDGKGAIPFMKELKNGTTLAVQTHDPFSEAVFDLGNVENVVSKISAACNWK
ncbi:type VI secretion system-associated protein TagO [Brucella sp. ZJ1_1]|uniref:type VI secretion system-associated protein TagO n=1 Tax=Brucella sp. ZJ1_1 TaxID=3379097 RepID=UPI0038528610